MSLERFRRRSQYFLAHSGKEIDNLSFNLDAKNETSEGNRTVTLQAVCSYFMFIEVTTEICRKMQQRLFKVSKCVSNS